MSSSVQRRIQGQTLQLKKWTTKFTIKRARIKTRWFKIGAKILLFYDILVICRKLVGVLNKMSFTSAFFCILKIYFVFFWNSELHLPHLLNSHIKSLCPFKYERTCISIVFQIAFLSFNHMVMFSFDINIGFSFLERMLFVIWIIFTSAIFLGTISSDPVCS